MKWQSLHFWLSTFKLSSSGHSSCGSGHPSGSCHPSGSGHSRSVFVRSPWRTVFVMWYVFVYIFLPTYVTSNLQIFTDIFFIFSRSNKENILKYAWKRIKIINNKNDGIFRVFFVCLVLILFISEWIWFRPRWWSIKTKGQIQTFKMGSRYIFFMKFMQTSSCFKLSS